MTVYTSAQVIQKVSNSFSEKLTNKAFPTSKRLEECGSVIKGIAYDFNMRHNILVHTADTLIVEIYGNYGSIFANAIVRDGKTFLFCYTTIDGSLMELLRLTEVLPTDKLKVAEILTLRKECQRLADVNKVLNDKLNILTDQEFTKKLSEILDVVNSEK